MKKLHLIVGLILLVTFLLTGQYMDKFYNHMRGVADAPRLLYRTRHIFLLLTGLLNLALGAYFAYASQTWQRAIQIVGSVLIFTAGALYVVAFFYERHLTGLHTPLSHWRTDAISTGTLLHVIGGVGQLNARRGLSR